MKTIPDSSGEEMTLGAFLKWIMVIVLFVCQIWLMCFLYVHQVVGFVGSMQLAFLLCGGGQIAIASSVRNHRRAAVAGAVIASLVAAFGGMALALNIYGS